MAKGPVVYDATDTIAQLGLYVQGQMKLFDKLTLLLGGRYDFAWHEQDDYFNGVTTNHDDTAHFDRLRTLKPRPSLACEVKVLGLIRFGGHLSRGEYDVRTDGRHTEATAAAGVHG